MKKCTWTPHAFLAATLFAVAVSAHGDQRSDAVDKLFTQWNTSTTPGMNIAILRDGKELYAHSYGMANLELSRPNEVGLVYPIGSVSKQFVGYCIQLLASEGKLALTDDVRRYLPEMHDFGEPITLQMLLTHTSGISDNVSLLMAKGRRVDDVIQEQESFDIVTRQTSLTFHPGTRYRYSNGNYVLLAKVVERVSGVSFAAFLHQRVFNPLGMKHASVVSDPVHVVANHASGYSGEQLFIPQTASDSTYGNTGILMTIGDLAVWSTQFYEPGAMTQDVFAAMKRPGVLSDGIPITYGSGVHVESFHGLPYVEHTGQVPGFHAEVLIFPKQKLSVLLLANNDTGEPARLAFAMAEIYLKDELPADPKRPQLAAQPGPAPLKDYAGTYEILSGTSLIGPGRKVRFITEGNALRFEDEKLPLLPSSDHDFYSQNGSLQVSFLPLTGKASGWMVIIHDPSGTDFAGRRVRETPPIKSQKTALPLRSYAGLYYSKELDTAYTVLTRGQTLSLRTPRGEVPLMLHSGDTYDVKGNLMEGKAAGMLEFTRSDSNVIGFMLTLSGARAANLQFTRMKAEAAQ